MCPVLSGRNFLTGYLAGNNSRYFTYFYPVIASIIFADHIHCMKTRLILPVIALFCLATCHSGPAEQKNNTGSKSTMAEKRTVQIDVPLAATSFPEGSKITIRAHIDTTSVQADSMQIWVNDILFRSIRGGIVEMDWNSAGTRLGKNMLLIKAYRAGKLIGSAQTVVIILAPSAPKNLSFRVIHSYPHDSDAYTQGLFYENGWLYESTGQYGRSSLRKVSLLNGEVQQSVNLAGNVFGEGLAVYDGKILQITWKNQIGYVYDKQTFQLIRKVRYPIDEGWGLTWDGHQFLMTNGSEIIYRMDATTFSEAGEVEVYDNKGPVNQLNELEYVRGEVYANVYGQSSIVVINPVNGCVTGKMDLASLMPAGYQGNYDKVLNGIAWNPANGHLFVTGKEWPVLYEIQIQP